MSHLLSCLLSNVSLFIYGPIGSGKTTLLRSTVEEFNSPNQVKAIYVDGVLHQTTNSILREVVSALNSLSGIPKSTSSLIEKLQKRAKGKRLTVCIDHFERLKEVDVVDKILSLDAQKNLSVGLVLTANSKECFNRLSGQARSEIASILRIPRYSPDQVYEILFRRAGLALKKGSCDKAVIKEVSEKCEGNMTRALSLLKASVAEVESQKRNLILLTDVPDCLGDEPELGEDEQTLLQIMKERKRLTSSDLHQLYRQRARQPKSRRSFREFMRRLKDRDFVRFIGTKRWRAYEYCGD